MTDTDPIRKLQKLSRIWSERKRRQIAVRIRYELHEQSGCKVYSLHKVEELD